MTTARQIAKGLASEIWNDLAVIYSRFISEDGAYISDGFWEYRGRCLGEPDHNGDWILT